MRKIILPLLLALITTGALAQTKAAKTKTKTLKSKSTKAKSVKSTATQESLTEEEMDGQSPGDELSNGEPVIINKSAQKPLGSADQRTIPYPSPITTANTPAAPAKFGIYAVDDNDGGALVQHVVAGSPAEQAGLKTGDIIIKINNNLIGNATDLTAAVAGYERGEQVAVYFERVGQPATVLVKLGCTPSSSTATTIDEFDPGNQAPAMISSGAYTGEYPRHYEYNDVRMACAYGTWLGIRGVEVNKGIKVTLVRLGSPADRAGLRTGDIITRLDGERIWYSDDLGRTLRRTDGKVFLEFLRHGSLYTTELKYTNNNTNCNNNCNPR